MAQVYNAGNDLVAAFSAGVRDRLAQQDEQMKMEEHKARLPFIQKEHEAALKHIEAQTKAEQARIAVEGENMKTAIRQQFAQGMRIPTNFQQNDITAPLPNGMGSIPVGVTQPSRTQQIELPEIFGGKQNLEGVVLPQDILKQTIAQYGAMTPLEAGRQAAIENAKAPAKISVAQATAAATGEQARQTEGIKATNARILQTQKDIEAMNRTKATVEGQQAVAKFNAASRIAAASFRANAASKLDEGAISDTALMAATGHTAVNGTSNNAIMARAAMKKSGYVPFDPKDAEKLKSVHDTDTLYQDMVSILDKLPTTRSGAMGQNILAKIPSSELYNMKALIKSRAGNISHTVGGEVGRLSDPDIERAMGIMLQPGITKDEAMQRIRSWKAEYDNKIVAHILGGQKAHQQILNLKEYGYDPTALSVAGKNGKLYPAFKQVDGQWYSFDKTKHGYELVE